MSVQNKAQNFVSAKVCITLSRVTGKWKKESKPVATNILQILNIQDAFIQQTLMRFADCWTVFD